MAKKTGDGRFYRVHPKPKGQPGCLCKEDFNPEIDTVEDLKAIYPELVIKPDESLKLKQTEPAVPLKEPEPDEQKGDNDDFIKTTFFN